VELPLRGYHHGQNAVLAWHVARAAGVPAEHIARAFAAAHPLPGRSQWFRGVALHVCDDAYNANPDSLAAGMAMARHIARDHRLVVVLDTLEDLGRDSLAWHIEALLAVLEAQPAAVYVHGQFVEAADRLIWPATTALHTAAPHPDGPVAAFWPVLSTTLAAGDVVYLKASHASRLDRLTPRLLAWTPPSASSP
jgi:UDP-N-acetylmuramoyl-tripeptide--D-alanyl-D-alanine ligase